MQMNSSLPAFWTSIEKKFPEEFSKFQKWLTKYKKKNNWDRLFNSGLMTCRRADDGNGYDPTGETVPRELYELPLAMQAGVFCEYSSIRITKYPSSVTDFKEYVTYVMSLKKHQRIHGRK